MQPGHVALTIYTPDSRLAEDSFWGERRLDRILSHRALEGDARIGGLAVVRTCRSLALPEGTSEHRITDVAALIIPETTRLEDLTDPDGTRVLEQNFLYDLASEDAVLKRFLGREIEYTDVRNARHRGILLAHSPQLVLRTPGGRIEAMEWARDCFPYRGSLGSGSFFSDTFGDEDEETWGTRVFHFPELPEDLVTQPTLAWKLRTKQAGEHQVALAYQTRGLTWRADYAAVLHPDDARMDLSGWATIANVSGARYPHARIKLIAGDVRRVTPLSTRRREWDLVLGSTAGSASADEGFDEKPFFEHHLYTLRGRTTLENNQTKQIEFLSARGVPVTKIYTYDGSALRRSDGYFGPPAPDETYGAACRKTVRVNLEIENREKAGLGIPLPEGVVRVHKVDQADGRGEFIGEDRIKHTPRDETLRLYIGDAFDIVGKRVRTDFKRLEVRHILESFEIELRNHKDTRVTVHVLEHLDRWRNWKIERSSLPFEKLDAQSIQFQVAVPARGTATVTYTALYWWAREDEGWDEF